MYSSYSSRIRWKEPKLAALRRVRSRITMELGEHGRVSGSGGRGGACRRVMGALGRFWMVRGF